MEKINLNKPIFIAFSGGCFSGKTTTLNALKDVLESSGLKVKTLDELIRKEKYTSIDELRKKPVTYLNTQFNIIQNKILQELKAFNSNEPVIWLFDRALTDSLFYYEFYVDKSNLNATCLREYCDFYNQLKYAVAYSFSRLDLLIEFKPLKNTAYNTDKMRPANLESLSEIEYTGIHRLNIYYGLYYGKNNVTRYSINLSDSASNDCIQSIINIIQSKCKEK